MEKLCSTLVGIEKLQRHTITSCTSKCVDPHVCTESFLPLQDLEHGFALHCTRQLKNTHRSHEKLFIFNFHSAFNICSLTLFSLTSTHIPLSALYHFECTLSFSICTQVSYLKVTNLSTNLEWVLLPLNKGFSQIQNKILPKHKAVSDANIWEKVYI